MHERKPELASAGQVRAAVHNSPLIADELGHLPLHLGDRAKTEYRREKRKAVFHRSFTVCEQKSP